MDGFRRMLWVGRQHSADHIPVSALQLVTRRRFRAERAKSKSKSHSFLVRRPTSMSMRIDTPDDESAIRQPTDNIPPRDVIRTFMATRRSRGRGVMLWPVSPSFVRPRPLARALYTSVAILVSTHECLTIQRASFTQRRKGKSLFFAPLRA